MSERPLRKRIEYSTKGTPALEDPLEFVENKCSSNARKILTHFEDVEIVLWFDKHYHDRHQHGDESGRREGINPDIVKELVTKSIRHLIVYSTIVKGFVFANYDGYQSKGLPERVVLQEQLNNDMLNVV